MDSEVRPKPSVRPESSVMSDTYWHDCVELLGTQPLTQKAEGKVAVAAERAGITPRAAKSLYYQEATDPKSSIGFRVRSAAEAQAYRFLEVADSLENKDAEFFRTEIDRLRALARRIVGNDNRTRQQNR